MDSLGQLWPYVWRARRPLFGSIAAAVFVALLWAATLLLAFPLVKVLLEGQSLPQYVSKSLAESARKIDHETSVLAAINAQLEEQRKLNPDAATGRHHYELLSEQARVQARLSHASRDQQWYTWLERRVVPLLPEKTFPTLAVILGALLVITILKGIGTYLQELLVGRGVESMLMTLRVRLFRQVLRLDAQTLHLTGTANLLARFTNDLSQISVGLTLLGGRLVVEPLKAGACVACAFFVNWQLTLLSLLTVPVAGLVFGRLGKRLKRASRRQMETMSRIYKLLEETLRGFRTIAAYGNQGKHRSAFYKENRAYFHKAMKIARMDALSSPTTEFLATVAVCCALLPGAYLVLRHKTSLFGVRLASDEMDIAQLALLYTLLGGILDPARKLSSVFSKFKKASAACDRVFQLMNTPSRVRQDDRCAPLPRHQRQIEFERVTFTYAAAETTNEARPPALDDVSLTVEAGEFVAIVGGNGSGKSTLVNLLPRLYDPDLGGVRIDGVDLRRASLRQLREQIGIVTQETQLFNQTILENIRYGRPDATPDEVERAARQAHVLDFAQHLPLGLETPVGEKGSRLSGGQRQRIALARTILRDPSILILDEPTSAIDAQSERLIIESLGRFVTGRTTFLITHAMTPALRQHVDRVVVMDAGRIIATGPHEKLLATCPPYARLYQAQSLQHSA